LDKAHDLAVVRIDADGLPVLILGRSEVHAGDPVVAIGHPLGLEDTVSSGLVSAVRRVNESLTVIQISAPIAPGSSGGPLFDDRGEVIGVATALAARGQNLGFGMPVTYLAAALDRPEPVAYETFVKTQAPAAPARSIPHHEVKILASCKRDDLLLLHTLAPR